MEAVKLIMIIAAVAFTLLIFNDFLFDRWQTLVNEKIEKAETTFNPHVAITITSKKVNRNNSKLLFDHCELPELDPWDPTILPFLKPNQNIMKNCKPSVKQLSKLENGKLTVDSERENAKCFWRCLLPKDDYNLIYTEWIEVAQYDPAQPACDVVEVECHEIQKNQAAQALKPFYKFLHSQIYRKDPVPAKMQVKTLEKPNVHIILFDSVSKSQFTRSMPKTRYILREEYESIPFKHLNKVGRNSRPNGFPLLIGKTIDSIPKSPVSRGHKSDYNYTHSDVKDYLDGEQFIPYRFEDDGYVTMMSEDWALGVFNWQACKGFGKTPTNHYLRPFQLRVEGSKKFTDNELNKTIHQGLCREQHYYQMKYLQNFIDIYPDKPKFSLTWMSHLAHNDQNALYHVDDYFYEFFKNNKNKFNNSYVFVMGDHGNRFGKVRETYVGEIEDNNPFLYLSVPVNKRKDVKFIETLRENANMLITHYDLYATMVEMTNPPKPRHPNPLIKGNSLFHPLPQPRMCDRLLIPFEYCSCKTKTIRLPKDNPIAFPAATLMVTKMNKNLRETNETDPCVPITLDPNFPILVDEYQEKSDVATLYKITFSTIPGNGIFWGFIFKWENNENDGGENGENWQILSKILPRLNMYAAQAKCASQAKYASYCYCKNLIHQESPTTSTKVAANYGPEEISNILT